MNIDLEQKRRRLGLAGFSTASAGAGALLPSVANATILDEDVFTPDTPLVFTENGNGAVSWNPFFSTAELGYTGAGLTAGFSCGGAYLYMSSDSEFPFGVDFANDGLLVFFSPGDTLDSSLNFSGNGAAFNWPSLIDSGSAYFGYRIDMGDSDYAYGWVRFDKVGSSDYALGAWGYDVGDSITIPSGSPIPEPSAYAAIAGLFFAGVVAFSRWRKRRALAA